MHDTHPALSTLPPQTYRRTSEACCCYLAATCVSAEAALSGESSLCARYAVTILPRALWYTRNFEKYRTSHERVCSAYKKGRAPDEVSSLQ